MAKTGRKAKPTALRILEGNREHRPINDSEPVPPPGVPGCPVWLSADAQAVWAETVPVLEAMGVMTTADESILGNYCQAAAAWRRAVKFLDEHGTFYFAKTGTGARIMKPYPQVRESLQLQQVMRRCQVELGMTPSARAGLHVEKRATTVDPLDEFMGPDVIGKVG